MLFLENEATYSEKKGRTLFNTPKQMYMSNLELFWQCSILAKNHYRPFSTEPFNYDGLRSIRQWDADENLHLQELGFVNCIDLLLYMYSIKLTSLALTIRSCRVPPSQKSYKPI